MATKIRIFRVLIGALLAPFVVACAPMQFTGIEPALKAVNPVSPSESSRKLSDMLVQTEFATPVDFTGYLENDDGEPVELELDNQGKKKIRTQHGLLEIIDVAKLKFRFTPDTDFRGEDTATVYLRQPGGKKSAALIRIQITNPFLTLKPALAVRGTGCIMCHASVSSNIVTDFGYGDPYFFGGSQLAPVDQTSIYSDEKTDQTWKYAKRLGDQVVVPRAPTAHLAKVGAPTLAEYLRGTLATAKSPQARSAQVTEVASVFIGAPSAQRIFEAAYMIPGIQNMKYIPDAGQPSTVPELRPLAPGSSIYVNDPATPLVCSGDLVVNGVVFLDRPIISTQTGCRIYATRSVFVSGDITYKNGDRQKENLQIVSARSINLGLGRNTCNAKGVGANSLVYRLQEEPRRKFFETRGEPGKPLQAKLDDIVADANALGMDKLLDAACQPGAGRKVDYERVILNAPIVFSRYQGNFRGSIISEVALMTLEKFNFEFDPVFSSQQVLPLLRPADYLMVDGSSPF